MTYIHTALDDLIDAMEYHIEQTRPIGLSTVALSAARAALAQSEAQPVANPLSYEQRIFNRLSELRTGRYPSHFKLRADCAAIAAEADAQLAAYPPQQAQPLTDEELADCGLLSELAAPAEPVALSAEWFDKAEAYVREFNRLYVEMPELADTLEPDPRAQSIASKPPEPAALSDEQIDAIHFPRLWTYLDKRAFARAIERAVRGQT